MASIQETRLQEAARNVSKPQAMESPSGYQVETGQAYAQEPMEQAKKEGMGRGALTGLQVGGSLGAGALAGGLLTGPVGWGILAAGLLGSAAIGGGIGAKSAEKKELQRQQDAAKQEDVSALSSQAIASQEAKVRREQSASAKKAAKSKGFGVSTSTPDEQILAQGMASGSGTGYDAWHRGQVG